MDARPNRAASGWYHPPACQNGRMKFRTGFVLGLGVGYVLGAKAGRERYEQIAAAWARVADGKGKAIVDLTTTAARDAIGNGLKEASQRLHDAADGQRS